MLYRWYGTKESKVEIGGAIVDKKDIGQEYRTKYHRFNNQLILELRRRNADSKDGVPVNLSTEIEVIKAYRHLFEHFLTTHCRSQDEFKLLFE